MTLPLLMVLVGEPHRIVVASSTSAASCSCDKDTGSADVGLAFATYGLRQFASQNDQKAAIAAQQASCKTTCDALP